MLKRTRAEVETMSRGGLHYVVQYLRRAAAPGPLQPTDRELLQRFAATRDEAAFAELVRRHGAVVREVCCRIVRHEQDAEDCFQAVFLVLAGKAGSVRWQQSAANWLYAVAVRLARRARSQTTLRQARERQVAKARPCSSGADPTWQEVCSALDEELLNLPARYRASLVLCYLHGVTQDEAARQTGLSVRTLRRRLEVGRRRLRLRLERRGLSLSAVLLAAGLATETGAASVPVSVAAGIAAAAVQFTSGPGGNRAALAANVVSLAQQGIKAMTLTKIKFVASVVLLAGLMATGAGVASHWLLAARQAPQNQAAAPASPDFSPLLFDPDAGPLPLEAVARLGSPRFRHAGEIIGLAYSPDSKWLASISPSTTDPTARLWSAATGKEHFRVKIAVGADVFLNRADMPWALGFSPNARQFLIVDTTSLRAIDVASGAEQFAHRFTRQQPTKQMPARARVRAALAHSMARPYPSAAGIAPDGKRFVLTWYDGTLEIRDVASGAILHTGKHPFRNYSPVQIAFSADSRHFTIWGTLTGDPVPVFETESGRKSAEVHVEGERIRQFCFLPNDKAAILLDCFASKKDGLAFYDLKTKKVTKRSAVDPTTTVLAVSSDGKVIVAGTAQGKFAHVIDANSGIEVARLPSTFSMSCLAFAPDGKQVAGCRAWSGAITVWDMATHGYHATAAEPVGFYATMFAPDSRELIVPPIGHVSVDWRNGTVTRRLKDVRPDGRLYPFLSPDAKLYAQSSEQGPIRLLDARTGKEIRALAGPTKPSNSHAFSGDSRRLASCGWDKVIRVWDVNTGRALAEFKPPEIFGVDALYLSHDGRVLAASFNQQLPTGNVVYAWDVDTQAERCRVVSPTAFYTNGVVLSPDGRLMAGGGGDRRDEPATETAVTLWDTETGQAIHFLPGHNNTAVRPGASCDFSPDGRLLATGDSAGRLRLWETATGLEVHRFEGHQGRVFAKFSPDGRLLLGTGEDAPCFVWDVTGVGRGTPRAASVDAEKAWTALAAEDASEAFQADRNLAAVPGPAVKMLGNKLKPAPPGANIAKLLAELDAATFAAREAATAELLRLVERYELRLRAARQTISVEARQRLDRILRQTPKPTPVQLRWSRAIMALEWIGTAEARQLLEKLANGDRDATLTLAARAACERLQCQPAR